jgi:hypothetical protein
MSSVTPFFAVRMKNIFNLFDIKYLSTYLHT